MFNYSLKNLLIQFLPGNEYGILTRTIITYNHRHQQDVCSRSLDYEKKNDLQEPD